MKKWLLSILILAPIFFLLLTQSKNIFAENINLVPNSSLETVNPTNINEPQDWNQGGWGNNTRTLSYINDAKTGSKSVKTEVSNYIDGDAKWYYTQQSVTAGKTYLISNYYKANINSSVVIWFTLANNTNQYLWLTDLPPAADWSRYNQSIVAPANAVKMTVFHLISQNGWLITDDYSVTDQSVTNTPSPTATANNTPSPTPTSTPIPTATTTPTPTIGPNQVLNPSLENENPSNINLPNNWNKQKWGINTSSFQYVKTNGHTGTHSVRVNTSAYTTGDAKWFFKNLLVTPGETYSFTDWYRSNVASQIVVDFTNIDGSHYYLALGTVSPVTSWTKYSSSFQIPFNAKNATVYHLINTVGWLITDDYSLKKTPSPAGFSSPVITLSFDDGWEDNVDTALPILKNYGFKATYFFATTFLENSPATGPINVSGPEAVKYIAGQGHEIGSHSVTHPDLTTLNATDLNYELTHSKEYLESIVGAGNVRNFATPFGAYNDTVINAIAKLYRSHRSTDEGYNYPTNTYAYNIRVQNMLSNTSLTQYQGWVNQAVKDRAWLVLVYHRVAAGSLEAYDTPLSEFTKQMDVLKNSGSSIMTMNQALNFVTPQLQ